MKVIIKILVLIFISINVNCQTLPLKGFEEPDNGGYLKDMENVLPFWLDTWEGTVNNKKYTFTLSMFPQYRIDSPSGNYKYKDKVVAKLKVIDLTTNQIIYDESSFTNYDDYIIHGLNVYGIQFDFLFLDKSERCSNRAEFILVKNINNPNEITYKGFKYRQYGGLDPCPYANQEDIPMFLPKEELVLTRQ